MPLPDVGVPLSLNEIHIEAGGSTGTNASINDADIRALIGKVASTTMAFDEWYGASFEPQVVFYQNTIKAHSNDLGGLTSATTYPNFDIQTGDIVCLMASENINSGTSSFNLQFNFLESSNGEVPVTQTSGGSFDKAGVMFVVINANYTAGNWNVRSGNGSARGQHIQDVLILRGGVISGTKVDGNGATGNSGSTVRTVNSGAVILACASSSSTISVSNMEATIFSTGLAHATGGDGTTQRSGYNINPGGSTFSSTMSGTEYALMSFN